MKVTTLISQRSSPFGSGLDSLRVVRMIGQLLQVHLHGSTVELDSSGTMYLYIVFSQFDICMAKIPLLYL